MIWRSTTLNRVLNHCAGTLNHDEVDRSVYEAGVAAHSCLQAFGEQANAKGRELSEAETRAVAQSVCKALIGKGRSFEGKPEPPLNADRVYAGRDIALNYAWLEPILPGADVEVKLSATAEWEPCKPGDPAERFTAILDTMRREEREDEEYAESVLVIRDFKTAWSTGPAWLDGIQAKFQGALALAHCDTLPNVLRMEVVNLRTCRTYDREYQLPGDLIDVESWQRDLTAMAEAIESSAAASPCPSCDGDGRVTSTRLEAEWEDCSDCSGTGRGDAFSYPYSPGSGCLGCPAISECPAVSECAMFAHLPEDRAKRYAAAKATADSLAAILKKDASDGPLTLEDGGTVGYHRVEKRQVRESAYAAISAEWAARAGMPGEESIVEHALRNFLAAMSGGFGVSAIDNLAKVLHPSDMDARRAWLDRHIEVVGGSRFEIRKGDS